MTISGQQTKYIKYNVGDIVREREWIYISDEPLYGIITNIQRFVFDKRAWIPYNDDCLEVYWFKWKSTEQLPATFVELVSKVEQEI